jgi:hypothetical protein
MARKSKSDNGCGSQCMVSDVGGSFGFWFLALVVPVLIVVMLAV